MASTFRPLIDWDESPEQFYSGNWPVLSGLRLAYKIERERYRGRKHISNQFKNLTEEEKSAASKAERKKFFSWVFDRVRNYWLAGRWPRLTFENLYRTHTYPPSPIEETREMFYQAFENCLQQAVIDPQQGLRSTDPRKQIYADEEKFLRKVIEAVRKNRAEVMLAAETDMSELNQWARQAFMNSPDSVLFVIGPASRREQYNEAIAILDSSQATIENAIRPRQVTSHVSESLWILVNPLLRDVITWLSAGPVTKEEAKGSEFFFGPLRAGNPRYTTQSSTWWKTHNASLLEALLHSEDVLAQYEGRIAQTTAQSSRARPNSSQRAPGSRKSKGWQNGVNWKPLTTIPETMVNDRKQHADAGICPGNHSVVDGVHPVHTPELCKLCRQNKNRNRWASEEEKRARERRRASAPQTSSLPSEQRRARSAPPALGYGRGTHTSPAAQVYPGQHGGTPRTPSQTRRGSTAFADKTAREAMSSYNRRPSV